MIMDWIRKIVYIFILVVIAIFVFDSFAFGMHTASKQDYKFNQYLYLTITDNTKTEIEYKIVNRMKVPMEYNNTYEIQMYKNKEWKQFDDEIKFNLESKIIDSKEVKGEKIKLDKTYGKLKKGRYRLIKNVGGYNIAAEFVVK